MAMGLLIAKMMFSEGRQFITKKPHQSLIQRATPVIEKKHEEACLASFLCSKQHFRKSGKAERSHRSSSERRIWWWSVG